MRGAGDPKEEAWAAFDAGLRAVRRPPPPPGLREQCLPPPLGDRRWVVLVVDDEPNIRRLVEVQLAGAGYRVLTASDGPEALRAVREERPDLIVLDVMMPEMSGFEVLQRLKDDPATGEIPVVMLTAKDHDGDIRRGWQRGTDFYMTKPFNPEELRAVVDRIVRVLGTPENPPPLRRWLK